MRLKFLNVEAYSVVVGFQELATLNDVFYPEIFIASNQKGIPAYFEKLGKKDVLESYGFECTDNFLALMLAACADAHPDFLAAQYSPNKKKPSTFEALMEDKLLGASIRKRLDFNLNKILKLAGDHSIPVYKNIERKIYLPEIEIRLQSCPLKPALKFEKTVTGTNYFLHLVIGEKKILPLDLNIDIFSHQPHRIFTGYDLFVVEEIDAAKMKPFLTKASVFIPDRLAHSYFSNFVSDLLTRVDVEIVGIPYHDLEPEVRPKLVFTEAWMQKDFEGMIQFYYGSMRFLSTDSAIAKSRIDISEDNVMSVYRVKRNLEKEKEILGGLGNLGFEALSNGRFGSKNDGGNFSVFHKFLGLKEKILSLGIEWEEARFNGRKVHTEAYDLRLTSTENADWFDLEAEIFVGSQSISFKQLLQCIKQGNQEFVLEDGTVFLIPQEWMERYELLARFIDDSSEQMRLAKSHFAILEKLDLLAETSSLKIYTQASQLEKPAIPTELKAVLRPYQTEGAQWLIAHYENQLGACLADDMGLGKTVQTLALLLHAKNKVKKSNGAVAIPRQLSLFESYAEERSSLCALIVLPASLIFNWENEIRKFAPNLMVKRHLGPERARQKEALIHYDIILTTYQTMARDSDMLSGIDFGCIILDESHYIKNKNSQVFKKITGLKTDHRVSLSGTPIENSLADLWAQMQFINPDILGNYPFFKKHFQDPIEKNKDEQAISELRQLLDPFILRRTKEAVLPDLPELSEQVFYSEMHEEQKKWVESEKSRARNELLFGEGQGGNKLHIINALMKLRQLANHPRLLDAESELGSGKMEDVTNALESIVASGHKTIVFSSFVKHLELYETWLKDQKIGFAKLTGESSSSERADAVKQFDSDSACKVFLMSIKAGGVGLNLTVASYVILLDPWWNPFVERQAIARAHRMGQENKVNVIRFIAKDSIEEKILKLQESKLKLAGEFIDLGDMPDLSRSELAEILS